MIPLERTLELFTEVRARRQGITVADAARFLGVSKASAARYLDALERHRLVLADSDEGHAQRLRYKVAL